MQLILQQATRTNLSSKSCPQRSNKLCLFQVSQIIFSQLSKTGASFISLAPTWRISMCRSRVSCSHKAFPWFSFSSFWNRTSSLRLPLPKLWQVILVYWSFAYPWNDPLWHQALCVCLDQMQLQVQQQVSSGLAYSTKTPQAGEKGTTGKWGCWPWRTWSQSIHHWTVYWMAKETVGCLVWRGKEKVELAFRLDFLCIQLDQLIWPILCKYYFDENKLVILNIFCVWNGFDLW